MNNNLWGDINNQQKLNYTDNIKNLLKEQSEIIKNMTRSVIKCRFGKLKDVGYTSAIKSLAGIANGLSSKRIIKGTEQETLSDANKLYESSLYGYELYSSSYKFRIFEIILNPIYPVTVNLDDGIMTDCSNEIKSTLSIQDNLIEIKSDDEFNQFLSIILPSKKLHYIISKLLAEINTK